MCSCILIVFYMVLCLDRYYAHRNIYVENNTINNPIEETSVSCWYDLQMYVCPSHSGPPPSIYRHIQIFLQKGGLANSDLRISKGGDFDFMIKRFSTIKFYWLWKIWNRWRFIWLIITQLLVLTLKSLW